MPSHHTPRYCQSAQGVPEQINLQVGTADTVVASWITFEPTPPATPPVVRLWAPADTRSSPGAGVGDGRDASTPTTVTGATHVYTTHGGRVFYMHFVALRQLVSRASYAYTVQSGGEHSVPSDTFTFRGLPDTATATRINMYGDLGVYEWNSMGNLHADCTGDADSSVADAIVHMGDHAYNEGDNDERRADSYMNAFQPTLASCPWFPVVGNHEYSGMQLSRYLNSTWSQWAPLPFSDGVSIDAGGGGGGGGGLLSAASADAALFQSTATSALGFFLSTGNFHAAGSGAGARTRHHSDTRTPSSANGESADASAPLSTASVDSLSISLSLSLSLPFTHTLSRVFSSVAPCGVSGCLGACVLTVHSCPLLLVCHHSTEGTLLEHLGTFRQTLDRCTWLGSISTCT